MANPLGSRALTLPASLAISIRALGKLGGGDPIYD